MSTRIVISLLGLLLAVGCASRHADRAKPEERVPRPATPRATPTPVTKGGAASRPATAVRAEPTTSATPPGSASITNDNQVITLSEQSVGAVFSVNPVARFVVLNYGLSALPPIDQRLNVYRQGVKVGELRVSGPVVEGNIAADILAGDIRKGDQVRRD